MRVHREVKLYAAIPLASMAVSFYSPRTGMYLYLLLLIPAFAPSRLDRLLRPGTAPRGDAYSEEP